jgi:hypothetical protein
MKVLQILLRVTLLMYLSKEVPQYFLFFNHLNQKVQKYKQPELGHISKQRSILGKLEKTFSIERLTNLFSPVLAL